MKILLILFKLLILVIRIILFIPVKIVTGILGVFGFKSMNPDVELRRIEKMSGYQFEEYAAALLKRNGFYQVEITQASIDYGIDIVGIYKDEIYAIQCKKYATNVGNQSVQEAFTGMIYYGATRSAVLTNSYFTKNAIILGEQNRVHLWDRDALIQMMAGQFNVKKYEITK